MAKAAIFIRWGQPYPGCASKVLKLTNEAFEFWKLKKQHGEIDDFEFFVVTEHSCSDLEGFNIIRGDREKLEQIKQDPEYRRHDDQGARLLAHYGTHTLLFGEEMQRALADYWKNVAEVE